MPTIKNLFLVITLSICITTLYANPPMIISTNPTIGETEVDPSLDKITVIFDQDMRNGFSWTGGGPYYPQITSQPYWMDKRTCVLPVKLEEGKLYRVGINSKSHQNFRSETGESTPSRAIYFTTKGASDELKDKLKPPVVIKFDPPNGAKDVDPNITQVSITFDRKMSGGMSWTGGGDTFPEGTGQITWDEKMIICTKPVKLLPNQEYKIGINSFSHRNFSSEEGIPVESIVYTFKTKELNQ